MAVPSFNPGDMATAAFANTWFLPAAAFKASDQSVTSSIAMVNDSDLVVTVLAGATYAFACYLDYEGGTQGSSDIRWQWVVPGGTVLRYQPQYQSTAGVLTGGTTALAGTVIIAGSSGAGVLCGATMIGTLAVSTTGGSLQLQWAQGTSSVTATIVHATSHLMLRRIG